MVLIITHALMLSFHVRTDKMFNKFYFRECSTPIVRQVMFMSLEVSLNSATKSKIYLSLMGYILGFLICFYRAHILIVLKCY